MWRIVLVILAACRDGTPAASPPPPATHEPVPAIATPARTAPTPALPDETPPAAPVAVDIAEQFSAEQPTDRLWVQDTEAAIRRLVPAASAIECHRTLCRVTVAGSETDVVARSEQLERGLRDVARSIQLTAPAKQADGTLAIRAYAQFAPAQ